MSLGNGDGQNTGVQLNPGKDLTIIQHILSGRTPSSLTEEERNHALKTAKKLMAIYCSGAFAEALAKALACAFVLWIEYAFFVY